MNTERLNLPGRVTRYFVESRLVIPIIIGVLLFGLIGLQLTPREENPQIVVPGAEVSVRLLGATVEEVEHLLLSPLEGELSAIEGIKHLYGTALEGLALVSVEFEVGEDKEDAMVRLYQRLLRLTPELPPGADEPVMRAIDIDDVPALTITLTSEHYDDTALRRMAERVLERLRSVQGVGIAYLVGGRQREFRVEVSPERLRSFGVGLEQVAQAIRTADVSLPLGSRVMAGEKGGENHSLRVSGQLTSKEQVEAIVVQVTDQRLLRVGDLGRVVDGPSPDHSEYTRFAFGPADPRFQARGEAEVSAVTVAVAKRSGYNAVTLTRDLRRRVERMQQGFLPPDVELIITRDDGQKADRSVNELIGHLLTAIVAVNLVLWWSLGSRAAAIVGVTIPLVFSVVMGMDLLWGPTLNRITFYALILSLGMLVDDATVVIENIHRHYTIPGCGCDRQARANAAIQATHEIGNPTTLATFTIVVVFLSLLMVTGMLGEYFYPVAFNLPVAMIASLFIAYAVTPWLARRWLPITERRSSRRAERLRRFYRAVITPLLRHRWMRLGFYGLLALLLFLSVLQPAWQFVRPAGVAGAVSLLGVPLAFLPKDNKNTFLVHIHLPDATPLEVTDRAAREVGELLRGQAHVRDYQTFVGRPAVIDFNGQLKGSSRLIGPQYAEIRVNLTDKHQRDLSSINLVLALRPALKAIAANYPGGIFQLVEDPPGPPVRATVLAEVYGLDSGRIADLARRVEGEFRQTYDMAETWARLHTDVTETRFEVDREKAALAGVDPSEVTQALARLLPGTGREPVIAHAHPSGERTPVPIRLHIPTDQRIAPAFLERAFVTNDAGLHIPLSELTRVSNALKAKPINHKNGERVEYVGGELEASAPVYAVLELDRRLNGMPLADGSHLQTANLGFIPVRPDALEGVQLLWEGELRLTLDAFRDMGLALGLSLLGIFLLLVGYYRCFSLPLLALSAAPLGLIGVFPAHWLLGHTFSAASMIGVIALAGVVVRNSLLIIDFIRDNLGRGMPLEEALREAGAVRLQPILLTTLSLALGTAIMVPDPVFGGLAIALIFGSATSAVLTLLVVPLLYLGLANRLEPGGS
ncbi:MAG: efflux RND transporter permease subunit [Pseudomonadota bacterium]